MNYPPFASLINLLIRGKNESKAEDAAKNINTFINEWKGRTGISSRFSAPSPPRATNSAACPLADPP